MSLPKSGRVIGGSGRKAERKTASRLGASLVPGSGCGDRNKGDIELADFLVENKSTVLASYRVKLDELLKINDEARGQGKNPALAFQFTTGDGTPRKNGAWVAIPEWLFEELTK